MLTFTAKIGAATRNVRILPADNLPTARVWGYKARRSFVTNATETIMSAKFYFYFFWHLKPLADREG
ncbi:hypothetical protein [Caballeronia sp. SBC1]|uniref:hypothetical protein n=1 Tax=Caballeronia sp. SBC1 TaxID=2705548 RepID=UPI0013E9A7C7|nr:hypothetical protein [Caballeronia sp. SBC1]